MNVKRMLLICAAAVVALAQPPGYGPPPSYGAPQLDDLVSRIALYPDPLLSQVLAAATYSNQIPDAARWADEHNYLHGDELARAIQDDQLPFDPSVQALLPFPSVLDMMASDMGWTQQLGDAFMANQNAVMDAVQRRRREAMDYGYLQSNSQLNVSNNGGYIDIVPVDPYVVPVPVYNPGVVFVRPRPGFFAGGAITFGGVTLGAGFAPWGWGHNRFVWPEHRVIVNDRAWDRRWDNRREYVHPYNGVRRYEPEHRPVERHEIHERPREERGRGRGRG
jgi:hypothetical protein